MVRTPSDLPKFSGSRLLALDALRGLSVASMIAVISPGRWEYAYAQLKHADWIGTPFADMIFPAFLVSVGVSMTLSFSRRLARGDSPRRLAWHAVRRSVILVLLGLALNLYDSLHLASLRVPGVLQRIGLCYLLGSLAYLALHRALPTTTQPPLRRGLLGTCVLIATLLTVYGLLLRFVPVPGFGPNHLDSNGVLSAWLDRRIFTVAHLWPYGTTPGLGVTFDPEGLLSTVPSLATMLMGVLAGEILLADLPLPRRTAAVGLAGFGFALSGFALQPFVPFIKKIWTPSFACLSGGLALLALSLLLYAIDLRGWRRWSLPLRVFGSNAILAFVLSWVILIETGRHHVGGLPWSAWTYDHLFGSWIADRNLAAMCTAFFFIGVNLLLLVPLYRRGWFLRI